MEKVKDKQKKVFQDRKEKKERDRNERCCSTLFHHYTNTY